MRTRRHLQLAVLVMALLTAVSLHASPADDARHILDAAHTQGGLIVHFGCGDGTLTAQLAAANGDLICLSK